MSNDFKETESPNLLIIEQVFNLSPELVNELRHVRESRKYKDEIEKSYDAILLDPGLGPATYLTTDGRVIWDDDGWGVKGNLADAYAAIQAGIIKTKVIALSELLPKAPPDSAACNECKGTGRFDADGKLVDATGRKFSVICMKCAGLGWKAPSVQLEKIVLSVD